MAVVQRVVNGSLSFWIDWGVVERIVRARQLAFVRAQRTTEENTSGREWYNPFTWAMPSVTYLDTDWDAVRSRADSLTSQVMWRLQETAQRDARQVRAELHALAQETRAYTARMLEKQAAIQVENVKRMHAADATFEGQLALVRWMRDTSAATLMVGATVVSTPAAVGILASGSALKGHAKWDAQESLPSGERLGTAILTAVGSFTFGAFKIGGTRLTGGEEAVLVVLKAQYETAGALMEGKSFGQAVADGGAIVAGAGAEAIFKAGPMKKLLGRAAVPISAHVKELVDRGVRSLGGAAAPRSNGASGRVGAPAPSLHGAGRQPPGPLALPKPDLSRVIGTPGRANDGGEAAASGASARLLARATLTDMGLLARAILQEAPDGATLRPGVLA